MGEFYKSKIDWWVTAVVVATVLIAFLGLVIDGELLITGVVMAVLLAAAEIAIFGSVKYQISGSRLGIRNLFYKWEWFSIDKIREVKKTSGILSAPALSTRRIAIRFSDKRILKSAMPLEISPIDRDAFIARLKEINPEIIVK